VQGRIKFTEQGEVLSFKYSNPETAVYELTMGITGLMKSSLGLLDPVAGDPPEFIEVMDQIARTGEQTYRDLTDCRAELLDLFYEGTPVREIGLLNIGSRPSHRRRGDRSKDSVRAIPWVFGWAQARYTLPAWYGIGSGLQSWHGGDPARVETLRRMYREWPFFRALLGNSQMALFKARMDIAREYSELCTDTASAAEVQRIIEAEHALTVANILDVAQITALLGENPGLELTLSRRDPYLDPINHLQIILLRRHRRETQTTGEPGSQWMDPLLRSINALAAGLRNTG
jgi:phosphoenolpyruvate carboxylase